MPTTVQVKIKEQDTVRTESHEIEDIEFWQYEEMMKVVTDVFSEAERNPEVAAMVNDFLGSLENENDDLVLDQKFIKGIIGSFELFAVKLPGHAIKLVSVMSGIDLAILKKQKLMKVLDIYDAVIEENDIEALVERGKKSFAKTKRKLAFKIGVAKVTNAIKPSAQH
ncbi:hypothetical protein CHH91_04620 [Virgibacillus sp. 7505]|uniref:hypothetical protein n=1 Tax=Virgibacillus sp. 7505 TaxID=2022548 RepID=UPI000BA53FA6|nr:hypothetical protein [Virgibacillus sp. 7505]PAE17293.1 hypothetical protein CHH91_04620 [Virgibacillus sp. 7505]